MSETTEATTTKEVVAETPVVTKKVTPTAFCLAFNEVVNGTATFTASSVANESVETVTEGELVPKSRQGLAALLGMKYNAVVNRERNYRESGANLLEMTNAKRGRSLNVSAMNAAIAEAAKEDKAADVAAS